MLRLFITKKILRYKKRSLGSENYLALRRLLDRMASKISSLPEKCVRREVMAGNVPAEWISWEGKNTKRVILYLHGGGYALGSPASHRVLTMRLARESGASVLVIDYRLAPENPQPAALEDALMAYEWLLGEGFDHTRIAVMGDSAGGGLAMVLLQTIRDKKLPLPGCGIFLSPWTDLACTGRSQFERAKKDVLLSQSILQGYAQLYAGGRDLTSPGISPLYGDFKNLPPLLFHVGSDEVLLDDSLRAAEKAKRAETEVHIEVWPKMMHVWHLMTFFIPEAKKAVTGIGDFIDSHIPVNSECNEREMSDNV